MNISTKCNCCVCEQVCAYKQIYENGVKAILNTNIQYGNGAFCELRNYPHIEVSIIAAYKKAELEAEIKRLEEGEV